MSGKVRTLVIEMAHRPFPAFSARAAAGDLPTAQRKQLRDLLLTLRDRLAVDTPAARTRGRALRDLSRPVVAARGRCARAVEEHLEGPRLVPSRIIRDPRHVDESASSYRAASVPDSALRRAPYDMPHASADLATGESRWSAPLMLLKRIRSPWQAVMTWSM
jgi:hypothetical protein